MTLTWRQAFLATKSVNRGEIDLTLKFVFYRCTSVKPL
ncbi:hypothetical protein Nizo2029_1055 [Lactiplantibacillus plantarum]|nr:hypothetical protein Nizo2029_1055 [Lactiplantibacillus plantarum]